MRIAEIVMIEGWRYPEDRPRPHDFERILKAQRELEGLRAAMRDPKTGIIYTGWTHQQAIEKVPPSDETGAYGRLQAEWDEGTENTGFVDREGNFISRAEANERWGVLTIEDIKDKLRSLRR